MVPATYRLIWLLNYRFLFAASQFGPYNKQHNDIHYNAFFNNNTQYDAFSITLLSNLAQHLAQHNGNCCNDTRQNTKNLVSQFVHYAVFPYAKCRCGDCRSAPNSLVCLIQIKNAMKQKRVSLVMKCSSNHKTMWFYAGKE